MDTDTPISTDGDAGTAAVSAPTAPTVVAPVDNDSKTAYYIVAGLVLVAIVLFFLLHHG